MLSTYNNFKSTLLAFDCFCSSKVKVAACSPICVGLLQLLALDNASLLEIVKIPTLHLFFLPNLEVGKEMYCWQNCTPGVLSVVD